MNGEPMTAEAHTKSASITRVWLQLTELADLCRGRGTKEESGIISFTGRLLVLQDRF